MSFVCSGEIPTVTLVGKRAVTLDEDYDLVVMIAFNVNSTYARYYGTNGTVLIDNQTIVASGTSRVVLTIVANAAAGEQCDADYYGSTYGIKYE